MYDARIARFLSVDPFTKKYPELTPYQYASNTPIQAIDLDGLELFLINGYDGYSNRTKDANKSDELAQMKSYWINKNPQYIEQAISRFKEDDVRFLDGSQGGFSHGSVKERYDAGYKMAIQLITDKKIDFSKPITIISHSQGGAYSDGFADGLLRINPKAVINLLLLAPDGAEQFSIDKRINSAQFSFGDDGVVTDNKALVGGVDINLNPSSEEFSPYIFGGILKGLDAHSAPIDDKATSKGILTNTKTDKLFKIKSNDKN
jgi:hypothetical protein